MTIMKADLHSTSVFFKSVITFVKSLKTCEGINSAKFYPPSCLGWLDFCGLFWWGWYQGWLGFVTFANTIYERNKYMIISCFLLLFYSYLLLLHVYRSLCILLWANRRITCMISLKALSQCMFYTDDILCVWIF